MNFAESFLQSSPFSLIGLFAGLIFRYSDFQLRIILERIILTFLKNFRPWRHRLLLVKFSKIQTERLDLDKNSNSRGAQRARIIFKFVSNMHIKAELVIFWEKLARFWPKTAALKIA